MFRKSTTPTRALLVAASLALAGGLAQAQQTFDSPQVAGEASTMTRGQPNVSTDNPGVPLHYVYVTPPVLTTSVMGAGPVVYTYDYLMVPVYPRAPERAGASETSNVPLRAGEMSTMSNGAPNVSTQN